ncbi:hypothetical protein [Algoriphagus sediminis]|uniref:Uncharacterized protein n=1 Tax=Algoriphagus sediminis TaxID=3057113 RepID=A0ABT7YGK1_9BACT|nr:hypothetical protein [Algoriphagus sediminis]MDN3205657.1 hypothetical protein [Algoriphagus sediminis]
MKKIQWPSLHSSFGERMSEDIDFKAQIIFVFDYLKVTTAIVSMIEQAFGMKLKNTCPHIRHPWITRLLREVVKQPWNKTDFDAWGLTTIEYKGLSNDQLNLFQ